MRCCSCKRNIAAGADAQKMIVEYRQSDGTSKVFGYMMPDGPLSTATGQIVRAWHHKHFHVQRKREARGDAVTGRVLNGMPTGYEIADSDSRDVSERLDRLHDVARRIGKAVGDPTVAEAFAAEERGGPYPHSHHLRMETYQLLAHLEYAHGFNGVAKRLIEIAGNAQQFHDERHAQWALLQTRLERTNDPSYEDPPERDWRDQQVLDIDQLGTGTTRE